MNPATETARRRTPGRAAKPKKPGTLAGTKDAMEILGVPRSTLNRWLERDEMPQPIDVPAGGPIWYRADLEKFAERRAAEASDGG